MLKTTVLFFCIIMICPSLSDTAELKISLHWWQVKADAIKATWFVYCVEDDGWMLVECDEAILGYKLLLDGNPIATFSPDELNAIVPMSPSKEHSLCLKVETSEPSDVHEACVDVMLKPPLEGESPFIRGDVNQDGNIDLADAISVIMYIWRWFPYTSPCERAFDANDDGKIDLADAITLLTYVFQNGGPLAPPFEFCYYDYTHDHLGCESYPFCE